MTIDRQVAYQGQQTFAECYDHQECLANQIDVEDIVVTDAHTVVYPRAVMVEALDAMTTDVTVAASTRPNSLTVSTQTGAADYVQHIHELDLLIGDVAWLCTRSHREECQS